MNHEFCFILTFKDFKTKLKVFLIYINCLFVNKFCKRTVWVYCTLYYTKRNPLKKTQKYMYKYNVKYREPSEENGEKGY